MHIHIHASKKYPHNSFLAFLLVAIAIPTVLVGIITVSAATEQSLLAVQSTNFDLFDGKTFLLHRRAIRQDIILVPEEETSDEVHPAASVKPCDPAPADAAVEATPRALSYEDLSLVERATLNKQLRIGGCPQDVLPGYQALCESMLKKQKRPEIKTGLRHPAQ